MTDLAEESDLTESEKRLKQRGKKEKPELNTLCKKCGTKNYYHWHRRSPSHCNACGAELEKDDYEPPCDAGPGEWA